MFQKHLLRGVITDTYNYLKAHLTVSKTHPSAFLPNRKLFFVFKIIFQLLSVVDCKELTVRTCNGVNRTTATTTNNINNIVTLPL